MTGRPTAESVPESGGADPGLSGLVASGVVWTLMQKVVTRATGLITVFILARLLAPDDFGAVTAASTVLPIVQVIADLGITVYVLQHPNPSRLVYNTYFWASVTIAAVECGVLIFCAPLIADLFGDPAIAPLMQGLAPVALFVTLGAVPQTMLRHQLRFRAISIQATIAGLIAQAVAVVGAFAGLGAWALVFQNVTSQLIAMIFAWVVTRFRPEFQFSWIEFKAMVRYGSNIVAGTSVGMIAWWLVNFVLANTLGLAAIGYLNIASRLITVITDVVVTSTVEVATVALARIRESIDRLRAGFLRSFSLMYVFLVVALVFLAVSSPHLIPLLYGDQWDPAIMPAALLSISGIFMVDGLDHALYAGVGRPMVWLLYTIASGILMLAAAWLLAPLGLTAFVLGELVGNALLIACRWIVSARLLQSHWWSLAGRFGRIALPGMLAGAAGLGVADLTAGLPQIVGVLLVGLTVVAIYAPGIRLLAPATWHDTVQLARPAVRRLLRRPAVG